MPSLPSILMRAEVIRERGNAQSTQWFVGGSWQSIRQLVVENVQLERR